MSKVNTEPVIQKPLPVNLEAERAVLGAIILDNRSALVALEKIKADDFFLDQHKRIFRMMCQLIASHQPADLITITNDLLRIGDLEASGGAPYLASLADGMPRVSNVEHYARIVKEKAMLRNLIHATHRIQELAFGESDTAKEITESAASSFLAMMSEEKSSMPCEWKAAVEGAFVEASAGIKEPDKTFRINSGIPKLDESIGGLRKEVVLIVGMTSHGKSTLAMQFGINADDNGYRGLIFSAEMTKEALAMRELSHASGVALYKLRRPEKIHDRDAVIAKLGEAAKSEMNRKLLVVDSGITPKRVWSICDFVKNENGLDFVIIDYDQLVIRAGLNHRDDEFRAQAEFMAQAIEMHKRLGICLIILCQPRKVDEDVARGKKPPRTEHIFGSSAAGNAAHVILWIMRKFFTSGCDPAFEDAAVAYGLKARNDKPFTLELGFDSDHVLFVDSFGQQPPKKSKKQPEEPPPLQREPGDEEPF